MNWLDRYHDDWRNADYPLDIGIDESGTYVDLLQNQDYFDRSPLFTNKKIPSTTSPATKVHQFSTSSTVYQHLLF